MSDKRTDLCQTERLAHALSLVSPPLGVLDHDILQKLELLLIAPDRMRGWLEQHCAPYAGRIHVTGTLERCLVFIECPDGRWAVADLSGQAHATRAWPAWARDQISLDSPEQWLSLADLDDRVVKRLSRPRVLLAALYHRESFPLPRFPLGISAVVRAARATLTGEVTLADMQLGVTLNGLVKQVTVPTATTPPGRTNCLLTTGLPQVSSGCSPPP
ncbi:hypothetical protein [Streptomyces sp. NPDC059003]|uniref:hypothetical protein n=1 Tax=Streptomyces sp. NPDC059003 TaxID=3346691 RepID=UPI0036C78331